MVASQEPNVWLITGCSRGFGRSLISAVLARGDKVIATTRKVSDLSDTRDNANIRVLSLDVTAAQEVLQEKVKEAQSFFGKIDVLVNNAGYVLSGVWEELSPDEIQHQFNTNFFGALNVTRAVLPFMRSQRKGTILFMGSISGWHALAAGGPYSASKFALEGAVESLSKELQPLGIRVHLFVIGRFRTDILDDNVKLGKLDIGSGFTDYAGIKEKLAQAHAATQGAQPGNPTEAAERIVDIARLENITRVQAANLPLRIPLGAEAVVAMKKKCTETMEFLDTWADFAASADFQHVEGGLAYDE
ncbi:hypothetical protein B0J13DRAFT_598120 [Dactylonectria estremocensis]|uniref:NAD(P)-binding protein n=1 Tax=Dactylonectria estremocensis TaxID=1079267 RepID=A0A9P9E4D1_9HYPO|nr:hypothetical protein B0J13DRAFT_598120 [Dactylonectria estremocensis]